MGRASHLVRAGVLLNWAEGPDMNSLFIHFIVEQDNASPLTPPGILVNLVIIHDFSSRKLLDIGLPDNLLGIQ